LLERKSSPPNGLQETLIRYGEKSGLQFAQFHLRFIAPYLSAEDADSIQECIHAVFEGKDSKKCYIEKSYARIVDVQLEDFSRAGSDSSAKLGSLYGQAAYVDSVSIIDYSAQQQVGYGVLGGIIGGLMDSSPSRNIAKNYFLKDKVGNLHRILVVDSSVVHLPVGTCVRYIKPYLIEQSNESNCAEVQK